MKTPSHLTFVLSLILAATASAAAEPGVRIDVTAGRVGVTDWIVEQRLDLSAAARLLEIEGPVEPRKLRVLELDEDDQPVAARPFQIDRTVAPGVFVVTWRMPGTTPAEGTRHFVIVFDGHGQTPAHDAPIGVKTEGKTITIANGPIVLEHALSAGGMIRRVEVGPAGGDLRWEDRVWGDWYWRGKHTYHLADHDATSMKVVAAGPLRVVVETRSAYLNEGNVASSRPRATHRFTTYAGQPVTRVEAVASQDYQKQWFHFQKAHINLDRASVKGTARDEASGRWAAAFSNDLLIGIADGLKPVVETGPALLSEADVRWTTLDSAWQTTLFWGAGKKDVNRLRTWSAILDAPPALAVQLPPLTERIAAAETALGGLRKKSTTLTGEDWAHHHARAVVGRSFLADAAKKLEAGAFGDAEQALRRAEAALGNETRDLSVTDGVVAGLVGGHPCLANDKVAYVWAHVDEGAGLLSVYDRRSEREMLTVAPTAARLWRIAVKNETGRTSYANEASPCTVEHRPHGLRFSWKTEAPVRMDATLDPDGSVLRLRLSARAGPTGEGLQTVIFPIVDGIRPLTPGGAGDIVLDSYATGARNASPLISGNVISSPYPQGMQFNALYAEGPDAEGQGFYAAAHDPEAHAKDLTWTPQKANGTLGLTITCPIGGWAGPELIREYATPGDVVIGPFQGDWYDAALLYRKWALTAPWCAKGPIHARTDYPRWLAEAPYWTIGSLSSEAGIQNQIDIAETFGLPVGVCHAYGWWFQPHQDDGYPDYFPPRLGVQGLQRSVQKLQGAGMRVVPYVNGLLWDRDTESWRADDAQQGAIKGPEGQLLVLGFGGNRHVAMCPGSELWQRKSTEFCSELVDRYGVDGVYFDFLTAQFGDCHDADHGHAIAGGNFWTQAARAYYGRMRREMKRINPDAIVTGEHNAEWVIDLLDTQLAMSDEKARGLPLFQAVYHGYTLIYGLPGNRGPYRGDLEPQTVGRWWLRGNQNGWYNQESLVVRAMRGEPKARKWLPHARNYLKLLRCHHLFARPYLAYGRMLRPPRIEGGLPPVRIDSSRGSWGIPVVDGSAWQAPDGSVGVFFLNYDKNQSHEFSWTVNLSAGVGWDGGARLVLSRWTMKDGLVRVVETTGGELTRKITIEPWGLIALKLETTP